MTRTEEVAVEKEEDSWTNLSDIDRTEGLTGCPCF